MNNIAIKGFCVGIVGTNCYLVWNKETKEAFIVDPGDSGQKIYNQVVMNDLSLKAILLTHGHFDHIMGINDLKGVEAVKDVPVYVHEAEAGMLESAKENMSGMIGAYYTTKADHLVKDGDILDIAGMKIKVLYTPGHTRGGVCYYIEDEKTLFSGDTLFHCSIGRTDFPGGSMSQLVRGIKEKLFVLPDDTQVYPGHEAFTEIGYEKQHNPFLA